MTSSWKNKDTRTTHRKLTTQTAFEKTKKKDTQWGHLKTQTGKYQVFLGGTNSLLKRNRHSAKRVEKVGNQTKIFQKDRQMLANQKVDTVMSPFKSWEQEQEEKRLNLIAKGKDRGSIYPLPQNPFFKPNEFKEKYEVPKNKDLTVRKSIEKIRQQATKALQCLKNKHRKLPTSVKTSFYDYY